RQTATHSTNDKPLKLRRTPRHRAALDPADVTVHALLHRRDHGADLALRSLDLQLHPTVRQIAHAAADIEFLRHLQGRVTETDTLHMTRKPHPLKVNIQHGENGHE